MDSALLSIIRADVAHFRSCHRYNAINVQHRALAKELDKAHANFQEFERKDIKSRWAGCQCLACPSLRPRCPEHGWCGLGREDLKHVKQKLKKLEEKMAKDTAKSQELHAELGQLQEDVPALQARAADLELQLAKAQEVGDRQSSLLLDWQALLASCPQQQADARCSTRLCCSPCCQARSDTEDGIRAEVEGYRAQLEVVKADLAPWEKQMKEVQARINVATSERGLLTKQHEDAKQRFLDAQLSLKAAHETAFNKAGQIKEMEAAVDKYR